MELLGTILGSCRRAHRHGLRIQTLGLALAYCSLANQNT